MKILLLPTSQYSLPQKVIPAKAGIQALKSGRLSKNVFLPWVIPAKAGIQASKSCTLDSCFRRNDIKAGFRTAWTSCFDRILVGNWECENGTSI